MIDRNLWVYDIETLASMFSYTAINVDTQEIVKFVIHRQKDEFASLMNHLKRCKGQIGFNNINFDYPIIHYMMLNYNKWTNDYLSEIVIIDLIYQKAQKIISAQNNDAKVFVNISDKEIIIPQLDLFKINHFDNKAKRTSLKNVQININYPNVQDMPIDHTCTDITLEQIDEILEYNLNDVLSTYEFYKLCIDKIELRKSIGKLYNLNLINKSDSAIGTEILKKEYCSKANVEFKDIKDLKSPYLNLKFSSIISNRVSFKSIELNNFLNKLKNINFRDFESKDIIFRGVKYTFAKGGLHSNNKPKIYKTTDDILIVDQDFGSFYPGILISENRYPKHLGKEFTQVLKDLTDKRLQAKKDGDKVTTDSLKITINSIYGNLGNEYSFVCDYTTMYSVTINGQLFLLMLIEQLTEIDGIDCFYANTDGSTYLIKKDKLQEFYDICNKFAQYISIPIEYANYNKCIIRDCNNYIIQTDSNKLKTKGFFVKDREIYQDNSFRIIQIALEKYFINGISIKETILNHTNIYDFCGRQKFTKDSCGETHEISNGNKLVIKQQKNVRYYISTNGKTFLKQYTKGSEEFIHKGYKVTIFNKFEQKENYNIDYSFYIKECNKIIDVIEDKQIDLFDMIKEVENGI